MTQAEREYHHYLIRIIRPEILYCFEFLGITSCERCGSKKLLEIHHKRYSLDITLKDLEFICHKCHAKQTTKDRREGKTNKITKI